MKTLDFYKAFYDRELKRRFDLDNALSIPIGLIAILIGIISYIISDLNFSGNMTTNCIIAFLTIMSVLLIFGAIYRLAKSYNNVFKGHKYLNFALTKEIRGFEKNIESYNSQVNDKDRLDLEDQLIEAMNRYTDNHILINDYRQYNLRNAKSLIIGSIFIILLALVLVIINKYLS